MSAEQALIVGLPDTAANRALVAETTSAAARSRKAEPGDRLDIARFEALATRLEQLAINDPHAPRTLMRGAPPVRRGALLRR